jgi:hypothetical protein
MLYIDGENKHIVDGILNSVAFLRCWELYLMEPLFPGCTFRISGSTHADAFVVCIEILILSLCNPRLHAKLTSIG